MKDTAAIKTKPGLRAEFSSLVRGEDGRINPAGLSALFGLVAWNVASMSAYLYTQTQGMAQKTALLTGSVAAGYGVLSATMLRKGHKEFFAHLKKKILPYGSAYLLSRTAGVCLPFALVAGERAAHYAAQGEYGKAAAAGGITLVFGGLSLAAMQPSWKRTKLISTYSCMKGFLYASLAITSGSIVADRLFPDHEDISPPETMIIAPQITPPSDP